MALAVGGNALIDSQFILKEKLGITYGSIVGDFGCGGAGYFVFAASKLVGPDGLVYAVDVLRSVLGHIESRKALEHIQNIKTVWSNLEIFGGTPINNSSCDYAVLANILFQNTKRQEIFRETSRMLKPGGKLAVIDWNEGRLFIGPQQKEKVSVSEASTLAAAVGLQERERFPAGKWHYGILFEK